MILKIYDKKEAENNKNEGQLYLKLEKKANNEDIHVVCVDRNGNKIKNGYLLTFDLDLGVVVLHDDTFHDFPFKTDAHGCLLVSTSLEISLKAFLHQHLLKEFISGELMQKFKDDVKPQEH